MRLQVDQLPVALDKQLAPVYFVSGDEPLQIGEAADAIRLAAKKAGYLNREVFTVESGFSWNGLLQAAGTASVFSDRKIIELRLPSGKPGAEGAKALTTYCQNLPEDTMLLITAGKLAASGKQAKWVQTLEKTGVFIQVWPLQGRDLLQWLQRRLQLKDMQADKVGLNILATRIEGNLLAAAQEIEKLFVLYGPGMLDTRAVQDAVADSSRYDVFQLVDSVLAGNAGRCLKILQVLQAEGIAAPVVLWALAREARTLHKLQYALSQGENKISVFRQLQIWDKRQQIVMAALNRLSKHNLAAILLLAAQVDRQIKGVEKGDSWATLMHLCLVFSGKKIIQKPVPY